MTLKIMQKKSKILLLTALAIAILSPASYSQNVPEAVELYFAEVRQGKYPAIPKQLAITENANSILENVMPYLKDSLTTMRSKAYGILQLAGTNARQSAVRERAVTYLLEACKDNDTGNAGTALIYLTSFLRKDFNDSAKDSIRSLFRQKTAHFEVLIKLVGFLEITDLKEDIRLLTLKDNPKPIRWAAIISLARMQDPAARQEMMRIVKKLPVNDDVIYQIFPDLIYTRDREAIQYMVELLHSDGKYCLAADAERETPIPCGYRIMEQLAPVIKNYPLEPDESGDIKTTDYLAALASVRYWFTKNRDFEIERDRY